MASLEVALRRYYDAAVEVAKKAGAVSTDHSLWRDGSANIGSRSCVRNSPYSIY